MGAIIGILIAIAMAAAGAANGADVPAISTADFEMAAHPVWGWLAGEGLWAGVVVAVAALVYKLLRPYITAKLADLQLTELYMAVEAGVTATYETYTKSIKASSADGKLTAEEAAQARALAREYAIYFMRSTGVDIVKTYGMKMIDGLIEYFVGQSKAGQAAKAVLAPLPELEP